jgi:hypothetical protein
MALELPLDRLVRKEVALGVIREYHRPEAHIGVELIAPYLEVESDDVIFEYSMDIVAGLAPARAEDAESELAQADETSGFGRASVIDWSLKDNYNPSDVSRYRETQILRDNVSQDNFPLTISKMTDGFEAKIARDARRRRRKLDNRMEWLIMNALEDGAIAYNDGNIKFSVDYGRPADQTGDTVATLWTESTSDPIGDLLARQTLAYDRYGIQLSRAIISRKILNSMFNSTKFTNSLVGANPLYTVRDWGPEAAAEVVSRVTGIDFIVYESVYRTRAIGSTTVANNRFLSDNHVILLPDPADVNDLDDTDVGFAKTLTSPHPEGDWSSGFYEWEKEDRDPWTYDIGTGIKAFPVFPHLELSWDMIVA